MATFAEQFKKRQAGSSFASTYRSKNADYLATFRKQREEQERQQRIEEARIKAQEQLAEAQRQSNIASRAGFLPDIVKEIAKQAGRTGAMVGDVASRLSPFEGLRNVASGVKTVFQRPQGETIPQAYQRGVLESKARPLMYERFEGKLQGKNDYRLPQMEGNVAQRTGQLFTDPEYRKPLTAAMEAPTYVFGGKPVYTAGKGLLARMLSRTVATQPEAIIEAGLATAGEEKPTLKSAGMNYLAATLLMSGISNIAGEIRISPKSNKVQETKKELENVFGEELPDEASEDLAEAFSQGVKKETILENAQKTAGEFKEEAQEEVLPPKKLRPGELAPIIKEIQETTGKKLTATEQLKIKDDIEKGISKEAIINDIVEPPKAKKITQTTKSVEEISKKLKELGESPEFQEFYKGGKISGKKWNEYQQLSRELDNARRTTIASKTVEAPTKDTKKIEPNRTKAFVYHTTPAENILSIQKEGLKSGGGQFGKGTYLTADEETLKNFIRDFDVQLRIKRDVADRFGGLIENQTAYRSSKELMLPDTGIALPAEAIEIKTKKGDWIPLKEAKIDDFKDIINVYRARELKTWWDKNYNNLSQADNDFIGKVFYSNGETGNPSNAKLQLKPSEKARLDKITKSQLTDRWKQANKINVDDALIQEAPNNDLYALARKMKAEGKSAEEFVKAQTKKDYISEVKPTILKADDRSVFKTAGEARGNAREITNKEIEIAGRDQKIFDTNKDKTIAQLKKEIAESKKWADENDTSYPRSIQVKEEIVKTKSQLTDIWNKYNKGTKIETPKFETKSQTKSPIIERINKNLDEASKLNENLNTTSHKEQLAKVEKELLENPQKVYSDAVFGGKEMSDSLRTTKLTALLENAKQKGDAKAISEIGQALAEHGRKAGQEIEMIKAMIGDDPTNKALVDLAKNKLQSVASRFKKLKNVAKEGETVSDTAARIVRDRTKQILKKERVLKVETARNLIRSLTC